MLRRILVIGGSGAVGALSLAIVQIRVGSLFGAGAELDAFFVGAALPSVLLAISAGAIANLVVPRLPTAAPGGTEARAAAGRFAALAALLSAAVAAAVAALAPLIVRVVAPGLDGDTTATAIDVLRVYSISIPPTSVAFVFTAYGFTVDRHYSAGASTAVYGLAWTALLFLDPFTASASGVALAGVLATGVQLVAAFLLASLPGARPWPRARRLRLSRTAVSAAAAVLGATLVGRAVLLLDPLFGSLLDEGAISQLSFATRITLLAVFVSGQGAAFSLLVATRERDPAGEAAGARAGIVAPLLLSLTAAVLFAIAGPAIAELLLARGEFTEADAREVGTLLRLYSPAVVVMTLIWALEAVLYAARRGRAVLTRALAGLVVNLLASAALVVLLGREGRPLGVLVAFSVQLAALLWLLRDDELVGVLRSPDTVRDALLLILSVAISAGSVFALVSSVLSTMAAAVLATLAAALATSPFLRRVERTSSPPRAT